MPSTVTGLDDGHVSGASRWPFDPGDHLACLNMKRLRGRAVSVSSHPHKLGASLPDGTQSPPTELNVHLVCKGERHTSNIWTLGMPDYDRHAATSHLLDEFSDFVAESGFGWGQQR
jgi:hypothetical protein